METLLNQPPNKEQKYAANTSPRKISPVKSTTLSPTFKGLTLQLHDLSSSTNAKRKLVFDNWKELSTEEFLIKEYSPALLESIVELKKTLIKSEDSSVAIEERLKLLPKRADPYSVSGSYIVHSVTNQEPLFIVKPAYQEPGAKYCPTGKVTGRQGIAPGESVVREFLAWLVQQRLQVDFGIPPVCITTMKHTLFGDLKEMGQALRELQKLKIELSQEKLFQFMHKYQSSDAFIQALISDWLKPTIDVLKNRRVPEALLSELIIFCRENKELNMKELFEKLNVHFKNALWIQEARPKIIQLIDLLEKQTECEKTANKLFAAFRNNENPQASFVSAQKYEKNDCSLQALNPNEYSKIPKEEFYKFAIDIILFNTDRHLGNVLLKKEWVNDKEYLYRLILIDHGFCLPKPEIESDFAGIRQAQFEFLSFAQALHPIEGEMKRRLLDLNIQEFVDLIKFDLKRVLDQYPEYAHLCSFSQEAILLLDFNLRLLQKGLQLNICLRDIASFQLSPDSDYPTKYYGCEMLECFKKVQQRGLDNSYVLNYDLLDRELERLLTSDRLHVKQ